MDLLETIPDYSVKTSSIRKKTVMLMDSVDKRILNELQKNAKVNMKELADELHLSKSPLYERVKRLEEEGYITRYAAIVNKEKIGKPLVVFCRLSTRAHDQESYARFVEEIQNLEEVVECYSIGGEYDVLVKIIVKDLDTYDKFRLEKLTSIKGVAKINSTIAIREFKNTSFIKVE